MPYQKNGKRDYKKENRLYNSRPEIIARRVERNAARRMMEKAGKVHKGDGKDVDHKTPLSKGGSPRGKSNLRVVSRSRNTSFSRNANGSLKSQTSKRERSGGKRKK